MEPVRFAEVILGLIADDEIFIVDNALDIPVAEAVTKLNALMAVMPNGSGVAVALTNGDTILVYQKSCAHKYQEFISDVTILSEP